MPTLIWRRGSQKTFRQNRGLGASWLLADSPAIIISVKHCYQPRPVLIHERWQLLVFQVGHAKRECRLVVQANRIGYQRRNTSQILLDSVDALRWVFPRHEVSFQHQASVVQWVLSSDGEEQVEHLPQHDCQLEILGLLWCWLESRLGRAQHQHEKLLHEVLQGHLVQFLWDDGLLVRTRGQILRRLY